MVSVGSVHVCSLLETLLTEQMVRTSNVFFFFFYCADFSPVVKRELHGKVTL